MYRMSKATAELVLTSALLTKIPFPRKKQIKTELTKFFC
jgi:hypothetical protein